MNLAEIEAELEKLTPDELRSLALKSWSTFVEKEGSSSTANWCDESDPDILAALDEALERANATPGQDYSGEELRRQVERWTSR